MTEAPDWLMTTICALSLPDAAVAARSRSRSRPATPSGLGDREREARARGRPDHDPVLGQRPGHRLGGERVRVGHVGGEGDRRRAVRSTELSIWTVGGTLFTTIDVSAEVVFTPSDTETLMS